MRNKFVFIGFLFLILIGYFSYTNFVSTRNNLEQLNTDISNVTWLERGLESFKSKKEVYPQPSRLNWTLFKHGRIGFLSVSNQWFKSQLEIENFQSDQYNLYKIWENNLIYATSANWLFYEFIYLDSKGQWNYKNNLPSEFSNWRLIDFDQTKTYFELEKELGLNNFELSSVNIWYQILKKSNSQIIVRFTSTLWRDYNSKELSNYIRTEGAFKIEYPSNKRALKDSYELNLDFIGSIGDWKNIYFDLVEFENLNGVKINNFPKQSVKIEN